jgi:hypothetical protein
MISERNPEGKSSPGGKPAEAAAHCAQWIVEGGGLFDEATLQSAITVHALIRQIFNTVGGSPQTARPRSGADPADPRRVALRAVEAAGTLVALQRGPRASIANSGRHWQIVQEICEAALRVVEDAGLGTREGNAPAYHPDLDAAVIEAANKALRAISKLAARRYVGA